VTKGEEQMAGNDDTQVAPAPDLTEARPAPAGPGQPRGNGQRPADPRPYTAPAQPPTPAEALQAWMVDTLNRVVNDAITKAHEYGGGANGDLDMMGTRMMQMHRLPNPSAGQQAAVAFYADGKVARIMAQIQGGQMPSPDSWQDLLVYGMIGLKISETGQWL
jgi:hypothetical protein